jgi:hypothetical protein
MARSLARAGDSFCLPAASLLLIALLLLLVVVERSALCATRGIVEVPSRTWTRQPMMVRTIRDDETNIMALIGTITVMVHGCDASAASSSHGSAELQKSHVTEKSFESRFHLPRPHSLSIYS